MPREINAAGYELVKEFEGLRLRAYLCPAGVWTIGYGHTIGVREGDLITELQADQHLDIDLDWAEGAVTSALKIGATDNEFAAMVSLCFNVGEAGFRGSTVLRLHNAGDHAGAARAFAMWNKATVDGKLIELPGLTRRRLAEASLYLTPDVPAFQPQAMPQAVEPPKTVSSSKTIVATAVGGLATVSSVAASITEAITQVTPIVDTAHTVAKAASPFWRWGPVALSVIAGAALLFIGIRYVVKLRRGDAVST